MPGLYVDFEEVRSKYSILDVCTRILGVELKQEGDSTKWRGACPFCEDKRAFRVTTDAGSHKQGMAGCFKCGPKGDAIATVAKKFGIKANEAAAMIVERLGNTKVSKVNPEPRNTSSDPLQKIAERLEHDHEDVLALGLTVELAKALGVGYDGRGVMRGRVLFPLYKNGELAGFMGYAPDLEPIIKFPSQLTEMPDNVTRLVPKTA